MTINPYEPSRTPHPLAGAPIVPPEGPIEMDYDLTVDDLVAVQLDAFRSSPAIRTAMGLIGIIGAIAVPIGVTVHLLTSDNVNTHDVIRLTTWAAICLIAVTILTIWWLRKGAPKLVMGSIFRWLLNRGDTSSLFGKYSLRLTSTEIAERAPKSEHRFVISAVQKTVIGKEHIFIYISALQALVVPLRAFSDDHDLESFLAALEQHSGIRPTRS